MDRRRNDRYPRSSRRSSSASSPSACRSRLDSTPSRGDVHDLAHVRPHDARSARCSTPSTTPNGTLLDELALDDRLGATAGTVADRRPRHPQRRLRDRRGRTSPSATAPSDASARPADHAACRRRSSISRSRRRSNGRCATTTRIAAAALRHRRPVGRSTAVARLRRRRPAARAPRHPARASSSARTTGSPATATTRSPSCCRKRTIDQAADRWRRSFRRNGAAAAGAASITRPRPRPRRHGQRRGGRHGSRPGGARRGLRDRGSGSRGAARAR